MLSFLFKQELQINIDMKRKVTKTTNLDVIKAMRRGGREAEMELFGPGFHSSNHVHQSKKTYNRKTKHKKSGDF